VDIPRARDATAVLKPETASAAYQETFPPATDTRAMRKKYLRKAVTPVERGN